MHIFTCPCCGFRWPGKVDFPSTVCPRCTDGVLRESTARHVSPEPSWARMFGFLAALGAVLAVRAALVLC